MIGVSSFHKAISKCTMDAICLEYVSGLYAIQVFNVRWEMCDLHEDYWRTSHVLEIYECFFFSFGLYRQAKTRYSFIWLCIFLFLNDSNNWLVWPTKNNYEIIVFVFAPSDSIALLVITFTFENPSTHDNVIIFVNAHLLLVCSRCAACHPNVIALTHRTRWHWNAWRSV